MKHAAQGNTCIKSTVLCLKIHLQDFFFNTCSTPLTCPLPLQLVICCMEEQGTNFRPNHEI